jgi:hypothetical protein
MLPAFATKAISFKHAVVAAVTALSIALPAVPALAWGQREQDTLKGAVGALVIENVIRNSRNSQPRYYQQPQYQQPQYQQPRYVQPGYQPRYEHRRHYEAPRQTVSIYNTAAARAFNSYSSSERRLIQRRLAAYGYYRGGVDGSFGPGTYSAISAYANANGQGRALASTNTAFAVYDGLIY